MRRLSKLVTLGFCCASLVGCGQNAAPSNVMAVDGGMIAADNMMTPPIAETDNMMRDNAAMATAMAPQQFANAAASSDAYEIAAAKIALDKSSNQGVKDFANRMVKDHSDSTAKLKKAAGSTTPDASLTAEQQNNLDALKNASAANFDQTYASQQVAAHEKALSMLQDYGANGSDAAMKAFANKVSPIVSGHLDMARKLPS